MSSDSGRRGGHSVWPIECHKGRYRTLKHNRKEMVYGEPESLSGIGIPPVCPGGALFWVSQARFQALFPFRKAVTREFLNLLSTASPVTSTR